MAIRIRIAIRRLGSTDEVETTALVNSGRVLYFTAPSMRAKRAMRTTTPERTCWKYRA